jgi:LmbE family N-acetylglucosaminyl deacetylase
VVACDAPTRPQFPELLDQGLEPFEVPALWLATGNGDGDRMVDIGDVIDIKVKAVKAHASQMENMGETDVDGRMREWASRVARRSDVEYGEAFRTFELRDMARE